MTDKYPALDLPPRDYLREAAEHLVEVALESLDQIALPPKRIRLERSARALEQLMKEKAT
jgi:hypothetical protein